ncbi:unnamed protein product [Orchesella dallaii]|uniref:glucan 1,3-beta-glucosidase n=1 Tax=Orchesella dallaii TaxID=48710 RepID=A0ABP1Q3T4_9HEXA
MNLILRIIPFIAAYSLFEIPNGISAYGTFGDRPIRGVNLGGWLVLEKWIRPSVFSGLPNSVDDEYKFCQTLGKTEATKRLRAHWDSWVTEQDILNYKNAGINHVRIPVGYWAFDIKQGEPWVSGSWDYVVKAVGWCKKYGVKVMIDLHGAPGSQNGNDHSGQSGPINFFNSDENLQRATNVIKQIATWANGTNWRDTVTIIELLNEPILWGNEYSTRLARLKQYYRMSYDAVRAVNDIAVVAVHDAFIDPSNWYYLRDDSHYYWMMLDTHIYQVFGDEYKNLTCQQHETVACRYRDKLREANQKLWTVVGEWSLATPISCSNKANIGRQQIGVYEMGSGWFFWAHKNEQGWQDWSFQDSYKNGWIRPNNMNVAVCL